jgi:beta-barrel assembly-enhancing protease
VSGLPRRAGSGRAGCIQPRLIMGLLVAGFALVSYFTQQTTNPVTGEKQYVAVTPEQEIALGLEAAPEMIQQFGGVSQDAQAAAAVAEVGRRIVQQSIAARSEYEYHFTLLGDRQTINAFALPGGPIFITEALLARLTTEGQLAGVLAHEVGHVIGRHSAERIAKQQLTQGLTGALVLSTYDPDNPGSRGTAQMAMLVGSMINLKYGREDELESDRFGVRLMTEAGYDPRALIGVMEILGSGREGGGSPEFLSTHPDPGNRAERIQEAIAAEFPQGLPGGLVP